MLQQRQGPKRVNKRIFRKARKIKKCSNVYLNEKVLKQITYIANLLFFFEESFGRGRNKKNYRQRIDSVRAHFIRTWFLLLVFLRCFLKVNKNKDNLLLCIFVSSLRISLVICCYNSYMPKHTKAKSCKQDSGWRIVLQKGPYRSIIMVSR